MHEGKKLFLLECGLESLSFGAGLLHRAGGRGALSSGSLRSVRWSRGPFKAASPERVRALACCLSVCPALPAVVCPARRQQRQQALVPSGTPGSSPGTVWLSGATGGCWDGWRGSGEPGLPVLLPAGGRARCCLSSGRKATEQPPPAQRCSDLGAKLCRSRCHRCRCRKPECPLPGTSHCPVVWGTTKVSRFLIRNFFSTSSSAAVIV